RLRKKYRGNDFQVIEVSQQQVSVENAVNSYLFNSQLVSAPEGGMLLIAPSECIENQQVNDYLLQLIEDDNPIKDVKTFEVQQSMRNGGGPACLRQRIVLTDDERQAANQAVFMDEHLYDKLTHWVKHHYRDRMAAEDLADHQLLVESRTALDELTQILQLGSVYPFQRVCSGTMKT
ncbi:MAG: N-succinylarginine dihydrolase, partial [Gammaproteobacteria bacterium]|nr:N-succinylarginine dihydrolase [Gammaproteobacteria bacterium]